MNCYNNNNDCCNIKSICCFGPTGPAGSSGILNYADFYALMPGDNAATVAPATDVSFPQDGPISGTDISRTSASSFSLGLIGTSQIIGMALITTTTTNSILTVRNPASNAVALTITPSAGGTEPVSAHLVITQLQ